MPEELNRIVTDHLADLLWTPSPDGDENLLSSGIPESKIVRVGNIMIDTLVAMKPEVEKSTFLQTFHSITTHMPWSHCIGQAMLMWKRHSPYC